VSGRDFVDRLAGGDGPDALIGNADNDLLLGGAGDDSLEGAGGTDRLDGGAGNDTLGGGGPTVNGGPPPPNTINNVLSGGTGKDTCSYGPIESLATRTDRGDVRGASCENPGTPQSQKTSWNGSAYTFSFRNIDDASVHAAVFDWDSFDGTPLP
jgi:Ca2+-binding RTX toxin-like protein